MGEVGQYCLKIVSVTVLCGLVQLLFSQSSVGGMIKAVTGLMVTVTVLSPCLDRTDFRWNMAFEDITLQSALAIETGESAANSALTQSIQEQTRTYILNKASELGAELTVEVELLEESPYTPCGIRLAGTVSPYVKEKLADYLYRELGIPEEEQTWIS